ncbi:hypothetical protein [Brevibacillus borstelensis]|uniref:hypothetical protein n=1 Tax=Brevibacillus borstelensis TaxID=45462 RepID=UPI00287F68CE|nr:hypothetical protein [Brevibacillus borstelensis]WNF07438.1 hypothetical protein RFB14_08535 [Brevibacillus borstelensis]
MVTEYDTYALKAKLGDYFAREMIYRDFMPTINRLVTQNWYRVKNEASLTKRLFDNLDSTINCYESTKGPFKKVAKMNLARSVREFIKNRKYNRTNVISMHGLQEGTDKGKLEETLPDVCANVERLIEEREQVKEKVALLAKGDSRKEAILLAWSDGLYNDSALSVLLAQRFGGKPESHRQAIKRFRAYCQVSLEGIA